MSYRKALDFDCDSADFTRGFEAGRLWELLTRDPAASVEQLVHTANAEMVMRMAESLRRRVTSEEHDDVWMTVRFGAARTAGAERSRRV